MRQFMVLLQVEILSTTMSNMGSSKPFYLHMYLLNSLDIDTSNKKQEDFLGGIV